MEEVHGAAQAEEGLQDALNHQDEHDRPQVAVQGLKKSRLVQDWQASHHKRLGTGVHDPEESPLIAGAVLIVVSAAQVLGTT